MRILAFGTYQAANHPRVTVLVEGLRARGHRVVEANVPLGLSTRDRVAMLGSRTGAVRMAVRLLSSWSRLAVRALRVRAAGRPDALLVGYLGHFDVWLARALFPRTTIVLDHLIFAADTAADRGVGGGVVQRALRWLDRAALTIADVIVLDTEEHRDLVPAALRSKAVVVPVGAPAEWSAVEPAPEPGDGPVRVVFFGLFTPLQGAAVIGHALAGLPEGLVEVSMVGAGQDLDATRAAVGDRPDVTWTPWVEAADLPSVVAAHHVGLGVFGTTDKALRVVPNKVYQCAAAGTAIVTSDTPPQRRMLGEDALFVPPGDADALGAALRGLAEDRDRLAALRRAARSRAAGFRPAAVVAPLEERLARR
ncbi:glycosyltransferase [Curtobacterium sp. MCBD17_019]|uniref:glycosyltransferase n=1 Tax=Curtobacterium sp. MCBD17_019 TaxID=2175669 RepID=UPI001C64F0D6|nr:glycosyltransferase [Curtobacterium sp. MCBD17_019]